MVAARDEPLFVVFSLQLPFESHTVSFVSQFAPGALQSICGKLGNCPLLGLLLLFHCAVVTAIKQHNATSKISLFIFFGAEKLLFFHFVLSTFERLEKLKVSERVFVFSVGERQTIMPPLFSFRGVLSDRTAAS